MNKDIRIHVDLLRHYKTVRLKKMTGAEGFWSLIALWTYAAKTHATGDLSGMTVENIEDAAEWNGEPGLFVNALVHVKFLDGKEGEYSLHNWEKRNPWACEADTRSDKARMSRLSHIEKGLYEQLRNEGRIGISEEEYHERLAEWRRLHPDKTADTKGSKNGSRRSNNESQTLVNGSLTNPNESLTPTPSPAPSLNESKGIFINSAQPEQAPASKPKPRPVLEGRSLELFNQFWDAFDFKQSRKQAEKAWADIPGMTEELAAKICEAARREAALRPQYTARGRTPKYPQGWLNDRRWEDDYDQREAMETQQAMPRQGSLFDAGQRQQGQPKSWDQIRYENNLQAARAAYEQIKAEEQGFDAQEEEYEPEPEPWTAEVVGDE